MFWHSHSVRTQSASLAPPAASETGAAQPANSPDNELSLSSIETPDRCLRPGLLLQCRCFPTLSHFRLLKTFACLQHARHFRTLLARAVPAVCLMLLKWSNLPRKCRTACCRRLNSEEKDAPSTSKLASQLQARPAVHASVPETFEELRKEVAVVAIQTHWRAYQQRKLVKAASAKKGSASAGQPEASIADSPSKATRTAPARIPRLPVSDIPSGQQKLTSHNVCMQLL